MLEAWANISEQLQSRLQGVRQALVRRKLSQWQTILPTIAAFEPELMQLGDQELLKRSLGLRYRAKSLEPLDRLLPEAFALVREAGRRKVNMRHFDVQMLGGIAMHYRSVAEMQTGEGKTLTASLPLYLEALTGKGAMLATVNDYLAARDAQILRPLFEALGLTIGVVETKLQQGQRRKAYACDVTYGTSKEFGFDFLRDKLLERRIGEGQFDFLGGMLGHNREVGGDKPVQRAPNFILVDEADSILIDEARTPLIISALPTEAQKVAVESYKWAAGAESNFIEDEHYEYDHEKKKVELTAEGRRMAREVPKPESMHAVGMFTIYEYIERAIRVARDYIRDRQYVILRGEVVIVDEYTGRISEGRKWRDGTHQAVEAKEDVEVSVESGQAARVTVQDYFLLFPHLAGMTGTASSSAAELHKIYKLRVVPIPTNRPAIRERLLERIYGTSENKWTTIAEEVAELHAAGRPVLIGTRSIDKSEIVSQLLSQRGIPHQVLNAHHVAKEAEIVSQAGEMKKVTVSTNMAGRGTDIKLGAGVVDLGGMHVILTEMHDSARIDRQLIGRCGRQGDPGTFRQYLSLDDELLKGLGPDRADDLKAIGETSPEPGPSYARLFRLAQRKIETKHFRDRRVLMYHEKQRKKIQIRMGQNAYLDTPG